MVIKKCRQEKEKDKSCDLSSLVGLPIEISNRFLHDLEYIIRFIEWLKKRGQKSPSGGDVYNLR